MRIFPLFFTTYCLQLLITSIPATFALHLTTGQRNFFRVCLPPPPPFERKALLAGEAPIRIPGRRKPGWLSAWCLQREQFLCFSPPIVCSHSPHLSFSLSSHTALLLFMKKKGVVGKCSQNEITCL